MKNLEFLEDLFTSSDHENKKLAALLLQNEEISVEDREIYAQKFEEDFFKDPLSYIKNNTDDNDKQLLRDWVKLLRAHKPVDINGKFIKK